MSESLHSTQIRLWVRRIQQGDRAAEEELLRSIGQRLERLARKMLRGFPRVQRWAEAEDIMQNALVRLLRSLRQVEPTTRREFFGLAAAQVRRELIDLARQLRGPLGLDANHASRPPAVPGESAVGWDPAEPGVDGEELERWTAFHEAIESLPVEEREVVGLIYYHGWKQEEVADLLGVADRTVRRRWHAAMLKLARVMRKGDLTD